MWLDHWGLARDPFDPGACPFVALPSRSMALARLAHALARGPRTLGLIAPAGAGKSALVAELIRGLAPRADLRVARVLEPATPDDALRTLAENLDVAPDRLANSARLARLMGQRLLLILDGDQWWPADLDPSWIGRLARLDPHPAARVSVLVASRKEATTEERLALPALGFAEAGLYLRAHLACAGRRDEVLTPRGLAAWHAAAEGLPGALNQLARAAMAEAARDRARRVEPEHVHAALDRLWPFAAIA